MRRCAGKKEDGSPCERIVGASQPYCYSHDPERVAERHRNASRGGRSKANTEIAGLKAQLKKLAADVVRCLDKINMIGAFRGLFPYLGTIWQDDVHWAYFDGHRAGSRHGWNKCG